MRYFTVDDIVRIGPVHYSREYVERLFRGKNNELAPRDIAEWPRPFQERILLLIRMMDSDHTRNLWAEEILRIMETADSSTHRLPWARDNAAAGNTLGVVNELVGLAFDADDHDGWRPYGNPRANITCAALIRSASAIAYAGEYIQTRLAERLLAPVIQPRPHQQGQLG